MPIYEYICLDCRRKVSLFHRTVSAAAAATPICPACGGRRLHRLVSRVAVLHSDEDRMQRLADDSMMAGLADEDPRAMARFLREMKHELGAEADDPELDEVIGRLEAGESEEAISASLAADDPLPAA